MERIRRLTLTLGLVGAGLVGAGCMGGGPPPPACDGNYADGCVPIASDVDCEGGSGDGPAYVAGPVRVVGVDVYQLDADNDGWGCESW